MRRWDGARRRKLGRCLPRRQERLRNLLLQRRRNGLRPQHVDRGADPEIRHRRLHLVDRHRRQLRRWGGAQRRSFGHRLRRRQERLRRVRLQQGHLDLRPQLFDRGADARVRRRRLHLRDQHGRQLHRRDRARRRAVDHGLPRQQERLRRCAHQQRRLGLRSGRRQGRRQGIRPAAPRSRRATRSRSRSSSRPMRISQPRPGARSRSGGRTTSSRPPRRQSWPATPRP